MKDLKELLKQTRKDALDYVLREINEQQDDEDIIIEYTDYIDDFVVTFSYHAIFHFEPADLGDEGINTIIDSITLTEVTMCIGDHEYSILNIVSKW